MQHKDIINFVKNGVSDKMIGISTKKLVEELSEREGVKKHIIEPHKDKELKFSGPAIILEIID